MKTRSKKFLAMLLTVCMVFSLLPAGALAQDEIIPISPDSFVQEESVPLAQEGTTTAEDTAVDAMAVSHVVISQAYGGGGNGGSKYKNDFIELYNPTSVAVNLTGWSVQTTSAKGTFSANITPLTGAIAAGGYFLIQEAAGAGGDTDLPKPDVIGTIAMGGTGFKVALANKIESISGKSDVAVVDFLGAGVTDEQEGSAAAPAPSNTASVIRNDSTIDTDNNSNDFTTVSPPNPRNSTPIAPVTQVATPVANPAAGGVVAGTNVTLTCATAGAKIYYTVDGTAPTASSTAYTAPIAIAAAQTIKAIAVDSATENKLADSETLTAGYTIATLSTIAVARSATANTVVTTKGIVTYIDGSSVYMQDATAGIVVRFGTPAKPSTVAVGKELTVTGTNTLYNGLLQLGPTAVTVGDTSTLPEPAAITVADLADKTDKAKTHEAMQVKLSNVYIVSVDRTSSTPNVVIKDNATDTKSVQIYKSAALPATVYEGCTADIIAVVDIGFNNFQLRVVNTADYTMKTEPTTVASPVPSVQSGESLKLGDKVTFTCVTPDATIQHNTTSATAEDSAWTAVPADGLVMPDTRGEYTVYIRATKAGFTTSAVVTLKYVVGMAAMTSILEARKVAKGSEVFIQGDVIGTDGFVFFVQDNTAGIAVSAKVADYPVLVVGDKVSIRGTISGLNTTSALFEMKPLDKEENPIEKISTSTGVTPIPVTIAMLNTGLYQSRLVSLSQVTLGTKNTESTKVANHTIVQKGHETTFRAFLDGTHVQDAMLNIVGISSIFKTPQLVQQVAVANNGVTVTTADGSTVGDPIAESAVWSAPNATNPTNQKWPAVDGVNKAGAELTTGGNAALATTTGQGYAATKWNGGVGTAYWQIKFSTLGMSDVTVSSYHRSSGTGPSAFQTQYSVDGTNFFNVAGGDIQMVYNTVTSDGRYTANKLPLPTDANNKATVYVRWVLSSNQQLNAPAKALDAAGANQINSIIVAGNEYYGPNDVAPVKATPVAGEVPANTTVSLRTASSDTTIRYTTDGTDPTATTGTEGTEVTLTTLPMTIKAVAYKTNDSTQICPVKTFEFTQAQVRQLNCNKISGSKIIVGLDQITFTAQKGAVVKYTLNGGTEQTYDPTAPIALVDTDFIATNEGKATIVARATMENYLDSVPTTLHFIKSEGGAIRNYFGQLHSHTAENSDGSGTLEEAFSYAANKSGVDFLAVTDHSNAFDTAPATDTAETYNLVDYNATNAKWVKGHDMAAKYTDETFVGMYGYEMTWSGGPGHVNTFATTGFVSRNNAILNSKTTDKGMRAYYELLSRPESAASITQFNHPGDTFGNFANFGYYDPVIDSRITLVEVGNGEGAIGSGGYFPSYSEYTLALDKGWHLAPTNNQDNHKQMWGNANNARTVAYTNDLTREGIYQAMRDMRVYATEDKNLDIVYTLNNAVMGTILNVVPASAEFKVVINDPDTLEKISSVSIVSVGGKIVHKVENINQQNYTLEHTMNTPDAGYYYIRVQQTDKDIAVTAPIWLGAAPAVGMSELTTDSFMVVKDEAIDLSLNLFNNEDEAVTLKTLTYALKSGTTINTTSPALSIPAASTLARPLSYTPIAVGKQTIVATAVITVGGADKTYTSELEIDVKDPADLIYVGIDASHHNEYVAGNYKDSMGNFGKLAGGYDVRINLLKTSSDLMAALANPKYTMMVFTAPTRRLDFSTPNTGEYGYYSDEETAAVASFAARGGTVVLAGWGDFYESYAYSPKGYENHMAGQQNKLLAALGSTLRLADDEAKDNINKPGSNAARLYLTDYNSFKSPLLDGVNPAQVWSQYGGSTVFAVDAQGKATATLPASVTPVVSGYGVFESDGTGIPLSNIDSFDDDKDGYGAEMASGAKPPKYPSDKGTTSLLVATETVAHADGISSLVVVSGGAFMSNFEIKADVESAASLNYSNYNLLENLVETLNPPVITKVEDVVRGTVGDPFIIEGTVMSTLWNGSDTNTGFFDCIYVQDETGGINVFPVASGVVPGQTVRITGVYNAYEGERQLQDAKVKVLTYNPGKVPDAKNITTQEAAENTYLGMLVKVTGTVESIKESNGVVESIMLKDESGVACRVFIDGYITKGKSISGLAVGKTFTATGFSSINTTHAADEPDNRIRVRDRADVYDATYTPPSGGSSTPKPVAPNPDAPPVVVTPTVSVSADGSSANTTVSNTALNNAVKEANKSGSTSIVINATPAKEGDKITSATVQLPQSALATAGKNANLTIQVTTPVADVTLPNAAVVALGKESNVAISAVKGDNGAVTVSVTAGNKTLDTVTGGLVATLPVETPAPGLVAVRVNADGTEEIMIKSALTEAGVVALLDGSATIVLRDHSKTFTDTTTHWAKDSIAATSARLLFQGVSATEFAPDAKTNRGMVITVLHRLEREIATTGKAPSDVPANSYYANAAAWALEQAITTGDENGNFVGERDVTVNELATMVYRYAKAVGLDTSGRADLTTFKDADAVASWAREAFSWGVAAGIFTGTDTGHLNPGGTATRAQLSVVCERIVALFLA